MRTKPVEKCMAEFCDDPAYTRGLCGNCYLRVRAHIKTGKTTEEAEIQAGRLKPKKQ